MGTPVSVLNPRRDASTATEVEQVRRRVLSRLVSRLSFYNLTLICQDVCCVDMAKGAEQLVYRSVLGGGNLKYTLFG